MNRSKKQMRFCLQPISAACLVVLALSASNLAAQTIPLSQVPAGNGGNEPAPNIILSVDDSGSMGWDVNGCRTAVTPFNYYGDWHDVGSVGCGGAGVVSAAPARITALQNALTAQFGNGTPANPGLIPDNRIRLAWQAMHDNGNAGAGSPNSTLTAGNNNSMKRFNGQHRVNFNNFVNSLSPTNGTPSHQMMLNAYNYMKLPAGTNSPWADNPGTAQATPYLSCRRTYHIFLTDGAWNSQGTISAGNADGIARALPAPDASLNLNPAPPTAYDPTSNQTRIYKDAFGGTAGAASTLSDLAFRSWAEDLQPTMNNTIRPTISPLATGNRTVGTTVLQEFWNPRNDPATWQHITQHTIGFGRTASRWAGAPLWNNATDSTYDGDYANIIDGTVAWQNPTTAAAETTPAPGIRQSELWHMAINGRGRFYPARNPAALTAAFGDILSNILADTSRPLVSISANSTTLKSGLNAYIGGYNATNWSGSVTARAVSSTNGVIGSADVWSAETQLDAAGFNLANRFVASYDSSATPAGIPWINFNSLPTLQKAQLNANNVGVPDNNGQNRVNYLRGDKTLEASQPGGIFRNRTSRLGDIVNSNILYVGKPSSGYGGADYITFRNSGRAPMVYVGANDGMLHGFDAANGNERLAYIPEGIARGNLRNLTDVNYAHQYFVDGTPFSGDAKIGATPTWKTVLVGSLAGGGKGYFALDISNPANFAVGNESNLVITDTTATADPDIGNMYTTPVVDDFNIGKSRQIIRVNGPTIGTAPNLTKHRWAVVLGNGYNSTNQAPVLLVQYLDGAKEIKKISPCIALGTSTVDAACTYKAGNGLSTPQLIDLDGDGVVDVAYAGDIKGNVWKFDLSSQTDSEWKTSFASKPLFIAMPGQSFTTAPYWLPHPEGGIMLSISTGKNLTTADQTSTGSETVYGLWDNSKFGKEPVTPATSPPSTRMVITDLATTPINNSSSATLPASLVEQVVNATTFVDSGNTYFKSSSNAVNYSAAASTKRGWYMTWRLGGQRVLQNSKAFDGQKVQIQSTVPSSAVNNNGLETCTPGVNGARNFTTVLNMFSGNPSSQPVFDLTAVNAANVNSTTTIETTEGDPFYVNDPDGPSGAGKVILTPCPPGQTCTPPPKLKIGKYVGARGNWRETQ
jgi:type IV pilus assembly protein PilY1